MKSWVSLRSIFMHADGVDWMLMGLGLIGSVGDGFVTPIIFFITGLLLNDLGGSLNDGNFTKAVSKNAVALLYMASASWVVCFLEGYCWTRTGERQAAKMRERYLKAVLRQDVGYFDLHVTSTSDVITSVSSDSLVIQDVLSEKLPNFLMNASAFVASYIVAFIMLWRLTIVGFPFVVLLLIPGLMYGRALISISRKIREEYNEAGSIAEQAISLVRTVYAFGSETKLIAKFSLALQGSVKLGVRQGLVKGISIGSNGIIYAIWAFLTWYGSRMVMYHGAKGGTIFAVIICLTFGGTSLGRGLSNLKYFSEAVVAGERIMEVIERVPEIDSDNLEGKTLEKIKGEVEFKHVKFMYPSRLETPIFDDFCLRVPSGKTVALVGGSGSGKSTVLALLQRFYDPVAGEILLDGVSINKLQVNWLRLQMGLVSQEPALFATSIEENILFGKEDASTDEVVQAAKASNAHNFISQFPQGYKTQVGERGVQMSGGQKQRIAIARAIIKSPTILLLDEATSALDSESERVVQEALDNASLGRTTIVIAHRLSTIRDADVICVVHEGRIVEAGSHEALMENLDGKYTSLVRLQQMDNQESDGNVSVRVQGSQLSILSKDLTYGPKLSSESGSNMLTSSSIESNLPSSDPKGKKPSVPSFKRLMAMNRPEWKHALYGCLSAALFGAVQPTSAFVSGSMVSVYFLTSHDEIKEKTRIFVLFFVGLAVFSFLLNIIQHYSFAYMGEYLTKRIREKMLKKILTFEVNWFDEEENSSGAICSRLAKEANLVRSLVGERVSLLVQTIAAVAVACTVGLVIAWRLAIVMMAAQPVVVVCFYTQRILLKTISKKAIKAQDESSKLAAEAVSNIRTITSFSSQERILKLLKRIQEGPRKESVRQSWLAGTVLATSRSLITCTSVLNFWYGGRLITDGKIVAKQFFEIFTVFVSTGRVIADAGSMTTDLAKGSDAVGSVFAVLDRSTTIEPESPNGYVTEKIKGQISFVNVDFSYLTRPNVAIFKNLSIEIDQGKSTAIVGPSGSGKSTIISLIERFYDPLKGSVKIDGRDLKSYHLRSLRQHIALVSQEPALFAGTIRENIMYGGASENIDESEIIEAAKAANAHDFITSLTDGYDTNCGDRGVLLSGGQKQRIAIARAVLKNPSVLLLDEATSALDSQSERVVQDALERVMVGRTSVVIAHRLSTIQNCDVIAVLDKGKVVECGNHSTLLAKGPTGTRVPVSKISRDYNRKMEKETLRTMKLEKKSCGSIRSIFMHADGVDWMLMGLGFIGAVGDGFATPIIFFITALLLNDLGGSFDDGNFMKAISKNAVAMLYIAGASWVVCFLEGYCWTRTGERQASRMRERYLKAVLRQDVGYFDLHVTSTSDVITSVSSDSLVIQDVLSEKLPNFLMNASAFVASYILSFIMLWRLTIVGFPFVVLLLIPGLMYGRALTSISRKIREEYNEAGSIAEQAISLVRTVYAFGSERKLIAKFSVALQGSVKLGLRQGLVKGISLGSSGIVFAIWAFMTWHGSRMVMYHGAKGGTIYAVIICIAFGGTFNLWYFRTHFKSLGRGLSNLKDFSEAMVAGERIMEVILRVPDIDSDNPEDQTLEKIKGEVEFKHVKFMYPSRPETPIFDDFCLRIPSGKTVALVGGSGSGKSTVLALLQRFYDPVAGEILLDGVPINNVQVNWLRL
ncbi:hypothetical protein IGI04_033156 [Brassica rapa subsp. trilocularis]|uniref:Uncharacterized protein n=1 Tax=Brassica rapa subsp. trilocularis TaxID=1813537 RepID=A0ABQ7L7G5_BRACM|nr:hypothetical protein IGI04_033156 [Brassica rapa subsp. trilocularis]